VGFRRKVDDSIRPELLHDSPHKLGITNVSLDEPVGRMTFNILQESEISGIGEFIQIDDMVSAVSVHKPVYEIAADKSGSACNKDRFHNPPL
jgi:hypothetical protein